MKLMDRILGRGAPAAERVEPPLNAESSGTAQPASFLTDGVGFGAASRVKSLPPVSPLIAQRHATVFACCNIIAGDTAKVPLHLYQRSPTGQDVKVQEHAAPYLLNVEASPGVAAMTARFALAYAFTLRGKGYAYGPRDGGGELMLIDVIQQDTCSEYAAGRNRFYQFEDGAGVQRRVPGRSMVHLRYMAEDGWTGRSPIMVAAESMGVALARQEAAAETATGTNLKAIAQLESFYEDDESYQRNRARLKEALTEGNGIPIIGKDDKVTVLSMSAADQQLLESQKFDREQIAAIYRMPPSKLQMLEHGVKANGQQQAIDYRTDCLLHWAGFLEAQMGLGVLTEAERRAGLFFRHDFDALMQATTKERYEALVKAVGGPILTPDEARAEDGRGKIAGGNKLNPAPNMTRDDGAAAQDKDENDD